jgi:hypothetical protein
MIVFASQFCSQELTTYAAAFADEYRALQSGVELCFTALFNPEEHTILKTLKQLLATHNYAGVCLLAADQWRATGDDSLGNKHLAIGGPWWLQRVTIMRSVIWHAATFEGRTSLPWDGSLKIWRHAIRTMLIFSCSWPRCLRDSRCRVTGAFEDSGNREVL